MHPARSLAIALVLFAASSAWAQQPNHPSATLLVEGVTGAITREAGTKLRITLRGLPGSAVLLAVGSPVAAIPLPGVGGSLEIGGSITLLIDGLSPAAPTFAWAFLSPLTGELTWNTDFNPIANGPTRFQAVVADPAGTASGLRVTASITVTPVPPPAIPAWTPVIARGPYLQQTTTTSTLVLATLAPASPLDIDVGTDGTTWPSTFTSASAANHVVTLSGLLPATRYFYRLRSANEILTSGPLNSFKTAPLASAQRVRWIAFGDCGSGTATQMVVSRPMENLVPEPDLALVLGDIIYPNGEAAYYDDNFFLPYRSLLTGRTLWPAYGNHDSYAANGAGYFGAFNLPTGSSGTEHYYSFDYGPVHFVSVDSNDFAYVGSPMLTWLASDLAASTAPFKVAYCHHPPYTGGTHVDDYRVKRFVVPVLEAGGVDVLLSGHSHVMERTHLLKSNAIIQASATGSYTKAPGAPGTLYVVSGSGGQSGGLWYNIPPHPLMAFQRGNSLGHAVLEVEGSVLRGYQIDYISGATYDHFSLSKGADALPPIPRTARTGASPGIIEVAFDEPVDPGIGIGGAKNPANYLIDGVTPATAAVLQSDRRTVLLTVTPPSVGSLHSLTVLPINDRAVPPNASAQTILPIENEPWLRVIPPRSVWRVLGDVAAPPAAWATRDFDDSAWIQGPTPIGYGTTEIVNTFLPMAGNYATFFARTAFRIDDPSVITGVALDIDFDDGYVASLNGREIARRGVAANHTNTTLGRDHESGIVESYILPEAQRFLLPGRNVLAVEVHNTSLTSSDCVMDASLTLRGPSYGFGLRASVNGQSFHNHGAIVTVSVQGAATLKADGPSGSPNPIAWSWAPGLTSEFAPGSVLSPAESPVISLTPAPNGSATFVVAPLPPALVGFSAVVQAFQAVPARASNAVWILFVP